MQFFKRWQRLKELKEERKTAQFNRDAAKAFEKILCNPDTTKVIISVVELMGALFKPKDNSQSCINNKDVLE